MNSKSLSTQTCFLLILLFGILAYSNTFNVPFYFDDQKRIVENLSLRPPIDLERIWESFPTRFVANMSFALQYAFTGLAPWGFHLINLLIHLLASLTVFGTVRLLLRTPALKDTRPASHQDLFALATALLFVAHPIQTQAVTYIVQRMTSLATLFYLATLGFYLKARLEDARHFGLVFLFMLLAMLTKEISITLPFAILLIDVCFFPFSPAETIAKKIRRWIPFAACLLIIPLAFTTSREQLNFYIPALGVKTYRWDYLLTQFRVLRTYLGLLFFPVHQCLDYGYRLSSGWGDLETWSAFSFLLGIFAFALALFEKHRLLSFGILCFFLTLSPESSFFPAKDVIFEHRLYLPMFGFSLFFVSFLWLLTRSAERFLAAILIVAIVFSGMTYARNEVWKDPFMFWRNNIRVSPSNGRPYILLGEAYSKKRKDERTALNYYLKALEMNYETSYLLADLAYTYASLGDLEKSKYYRQKFLALQKLEVAFSPGHSLRNQAATLIEEGKIPEAIQKLKEAVRAAPENPFFHIQLGELYRQSGQETAAIECFQKSIKAAPLLKQGYEALALLYKEKGEHEKALAVLLEYSRFKKKQGPLIPSAEEGSFRR